MCGQMDIIAEHLVENELNPCSGREEATTTNLANASLFNWVDGDPLWACVLRCLQYNH